MGLPFSYIQSRGYPFYISPRQLSLAMEKLGRRAERAVGTGLSQVTTDDGSDSTPMKRTVFSATNSDSSLVVPYLSAPVGHAVMQ